MWFELNCMIRYITKSYRGFSIPCDLCNGVCQIWVMEFFALLKTFQNEIQEFFPDLTLNEPLWILVRWMGFKKSGARYKEFNICVRLCFSLTRTMQKAQAQVDTRKTNMFVFLMLMSRVFSLAYAYVMLMLMRWWEPALRKTNMFVFFVSACTYAYAYVAVFTSENGADISISISSSPSTNHRSLWPRLLRKLSQAKLRRYDVCRRVTRSRVISSSVEQGW